MPGGAGGAGSGLCSSAANPKASSACKDQGYERTDGFSLLWPWSLDLQRHEMLPPFATGCNHGVAVDSAPGRDVMQCPRVRADDLKHVPDLERLYVILGSDDGQRAKQASGIQRHVGHVVPA